jgi:hypothetical protein
MAGLRPLPRSTPAGDSNFVGRFIGENMKKYLVLATTLLAAGLSVQSAYAANDWKTFSGLVCQPVGTTTAADLVVNGYGVTNNSATGKQVICPLVQDHENSWDATDVAQIYVGHSAGAIPGSVNCTFYYGTKGAGFVTRNVASPALPANTSQAGSVSVTFNAAPAGGYPGYAIFALCSISSKASINAFWINESGATNIP